VAVRCIGVRWSCGRGNCSLVGAAELAIGVAAAYVAYDVIARGVTLWDAIREDEKETEVA